MIVAPPEPSIFYANDFVPRERLYAPSLVVASDNDPLMSIAKAELWAGRGGRGSSTSARPATSIPKRALVPGSAASSCFATL